MLKGKPTNRQQGFTLINALFAFAVFLLLVSSFPILIKIVKVETPTAPYSIDLYFEYIQKEIVQAKQLSITGDSLYLKMSNGTTIHYQKYSENIRRLVNDVGNEILLQKVNYVQYEHVANGVLVSVEVAGRKVTKRISMAPYDLA